MKNSLIYFLLVFTLSAQAQNTNLGDKNISADVSKRISIARSAGPEFVSKNATIVDIDGSVLVEGNNGWTCSPGSQDDFKDPHCSDEVWTILMNAVLAKEPFSTDRLGFSYMLQGDRNINNDDPYETDITKGNWIAEGPHIMIVGPKGSVQGITNDPSLGLPYVMFKGTQYEHIMLPLSR